MDNLTPDGRARIASANRQRVWSEETRQKLRDAALRMSDEHKAKLSAAATGRRHTPETRAKIAAKSRATLAPEHRAKIGAAHRGRPKSAEHRERIALARAGVPSTMSREARERLSAQAKGNTFVRNAKVIGECVYCFGPAQTRDHVIPRGRPGSRHPDNVVPACFDCNRSKQDRTPEEWFADAKPA